MTFLECLPPTSIPFAVNPWIPREGVIYPPTGACGPKMFFIGGVLQIHPDMLAELMRAARHPGPTPAELGRWADDGGPP